MLRRLSILGSLLLAACVPQGGLTPIKAASCALNPPTGPEAMAWRSAKRVNTAKSYRGFINNYPHSCYVPAASAKLGTGVGKNKLVVRDVPKTKGNRLGTAKSY
jgi:hypothetical protein